MASSQKEPPETQEDQSRSNKLGDDSAARPGGGKKNVPRNMELKAKTATSLPDSTEASMTVVENRPKTPTTETNPVPRVSKPTSQIHSGQSPSEQQSQKSSTEVSGVAQSQNSISKKASSGSEPKSYIEISAKELPRVQQPKGNKTDPMSLEVKNETTIGSRQPTGVTEATGNQATTAISNTIPQKNVSKPISQISTEHPPNEQQTSKSLTVNQQNKAPMTAVSGGSGKVEQSTKPSPTPATETKLSPKTSQNDPSNQTTSTAKQQSSGHTPTVSGNVAEVKPCGRITPNATKDRTTTPKEPLKDAPINKTTETQISKFYNAVNQQYTGSNAAVSGFLSKMERASNQNLTSPIDQQTTPKFPNRGQVNKRPSVDTFKSKMVELSNKQPISSAVDQRTPTKVPSQIPQNTKVTTGNYPTRPPSSANEGPAIVGRKPSVTTAVEQQTTARVPHRVSVNVKPSAVAVEATGPRISLSTPRSTRFDFSDSLPELNIMLPKVRGGRSVSESSATGSAASRPGILKKPSLTAPSTSQTPYIQQHTTSSGGGTWQSSSSPASRRSGMMSPSEASILSASSSSSAASLRSASLQTLVNVRSRERMFKRLQRLRSLPTAAAATAPSQRMAASQDQVTTRYSKRSSSSKSSASLASDTATSADPTKSVGNTGSSTKTTPVSPRRSRADSAEVPLRRRGSRTGRFRKRGTNTAIEGAGGLNLKEIIQHDTASQSTHKTTKVTDGESKRSSSEQSESEVTEPLIPSTSHDAFKGKNNDTVLWIQNVSNGTLHDVASTLRSSSGIKLNLITDKNSDVRDKQFVDDKDSSFKKLPAEGPEKNSVQLSTSTETNRKERGIDKDNRSGSTCQSSEPNTSYALRTAHTQGNEIAETPNHKIRKTDDKSLPHDSETKIETSSRKFSNEGTNAVAPDHPIQKPVSEDAKRNELNCEDAGSEVDRETSPQNNHKINMSSPTVAPTRRTSLMSSMTSQVHEVSETEGNRRVNDTETGLASNDTRKTHETSNKSNLLRENEGHHGSTGVRSSSSRGSKMSGLTIAADTVGRLSSAGQNVEMNESSATPRTIVNSNTSFSDLRNTSDLALLPRSITTSEMGRKNSETNVRTNHEKRYMDEDNAQHK